MKKLKFIISSFLMIGVIFACISMQAFASTANSAFVLSSGEVTGYRSKDNTTSVFVHNVNGKLIGIQTQGGSYIPSSNSYGNFTNCTIGTTANCPAGQKSLVRQYIKESGYAVARLYCISGGQGAGFWSPDSVWESGVVTVN